MGMSDVLARAAVRRAHVLVVEVPGWWGTRVAVEQAMVARGWRPALSPADADVLLVCGRPGERLAAAVDRVWDQVPGPRTRGSVRDPAHADAALGAAAADLLDSGRQQDDAAGRSEAGGPDHGDMDHGDMDHGDMDHGDMDHGDMDHGDMDHGDMEMAPGGIPLAGGDEDRDGLEMDVLRVPLGPVLPLWPAGLVLRCTLAGDVVTGAEAEVLAASNAPAVHQDPSATSAARRCDEAATVIALAGWDDAATAARHVRDGLLAGGDTSGAARSLLRLRARVARSRTLRWSVRGLGVLGDTGVTTDADDGPAGRTGRDVLDRLLGMLDGALADVGAPAPHDRRARPDAMSTAEALAALPSLIAGLDLAAVRLVVASLALDTARVEPTREATGA